MPDPVAAHLAHLEMLGRSPVTVYCRKRILIRLTAWLHARGEQVPARATEPAPIQPGGGSGSQSDRLWPPGGTQGTHPHCPSLSDPPSGSPGSSLLVATAADLAAWRASLAAGPGAIADAVSHARGFYAWAAATGLRPDNPAAAIPLPSRPRRLPRPVAEDDLAAALACASERVRPWLVLAAGAGLRAKEIALLRRENVHDTARPRAILIAADATKGHAERVVPMSAWVWAELQRAGLPASGWMFRRHDGRPGPNAPWLISQLAGRCFRAAGSSATLHMCRHRLLSLLYQQTRDLRLVQEVAGHASPRTTAGYTALDAGAAAAAVEALPVPGRLRAVG
jgi:integrase